MIFYPDMDILVEIYKKNLDVCLQFHSKLESIKQSIGVVIIYNGLSG